MTDNGHINDVSKEASINKLLDKALLLHRQGQLAHAEAHYRNILKINPKHFLSLYNMTLIASEAEQYQIAITYAKRAVKCADSSVEALAMLGNAYMGMNDYENAITSFERAIDINPQYALAHYNMGLCFSKLSKYSKAIKCYENALKLNPNDHDIYNNLGGVYEISGSLNKAERAYHSALKLNSYELKAVYNYATCLLYAQRYRELLYFTDEVVRDSALLPKELLGIHVMRLIVLIIEGRIQEASRLLQQASSEHFDITAFPNADEFVYYFSLCEKLIEFKLASGDMHHQSSYQKTHIIGGVYSLLSSGIDLFNNHSKHSICFSQLIMGMQCIHFHGNKLNKYKSSFKNALDSIPNNENLILTLGDIDVAPGSSLLRFLERNNCTDQKTILTEVGRIIDSAVGFFVSEADKKKIHLSILQVPKATSESDTHTDTSLREFVHKVFSQHLKAVCLKRGVPYSYMPSRNAKSNYLFEHGPLKPSCLVASYESLVESN